MSPSAPPPPPAHAPATAEGTDARARLLGTAIRLFAQQGYSRTSTRELAEAAQVNVAAISYYFGDKAGLYRAAFLEPMDPTEDLARFTDPALPLEAALAGFYAGFLEPLRHGDEARLCTKLHLREMLESTGLVENGLVASIQPLHDALLGLLTRQLGLPAADEALQRLALCIAGLGVHLHVGLDINEALAPGVNTAPGALDRWQQTLVQAALAMVEAEARRRAPPPPAPKDTVS
ncbi:CerR family C-terminal domain-containing protein [Piscinibacter sp. Jin2]|uniref:CerR family C-terminal domain-containing protein n=1 Tax=Aquariibacter lacus TaxID=2801332 RepID=A0A9X0XEE7_9BURK|nr:CerR family C-terminal domain-containing protein [Piscinibacter lacus]